MADFFGHDSRAFVVSVVELEQGACDLSDENSSLWIEPVARPLSGAHGPHHLDIFVFTAEGCLVAFDLDDVEEAVVLPGEALWVPIAGIRVDGGIFFDVDVEFCEAAHLFHDAFPEELSFDSPALDSFVAEDGVGGDLDGFEQGVFGTVIVGRFTQLGENGEGDIAGEGVEFFDEVPEGPGGR